MMVKKTVDIYRIAKEEKMPAHQSNDGLHYAERVPA